MGKDLNRDDWLKAARLALLTGGVEAVRVEKLARNLRVTKGSFYWHFKDREELLALLLREWEEELLKDIIPRLKGRRGPEALRLLLRLMVARVPLGGGGAGSLLKDIIPRLKGRRGPEALRLLLRLMVARVPLGEEGILPSDAAMFTWASVSPVVAQRVNQAERKRVHLLKTIRSE